MSSIESNDNRPAAVGRHFAIIGGGSIGPLLLACIAKEAIEKGAHLNGQTFHLIDPDGFGNGGIAYGQCHADHKLNSVPTEMDPLNPDNFAHSIHKKGLISLPDTFHDRSDYQPYIEKEFVQKSIETLRALGATIIEHKTKGFVHTHDYRSFSIVTDDPTTNPSAPPVHPALTCLSNDDFALTVGYGPNTNFPELRDQPGYIHSPYDRTHSLAEREPRLKQDGITIAVAGAGPALYDIANELTPSAADKLLVFSREGRRLTTRDVSIEDNEVSHTPHDLLRLNESSTLAEAKAALRAEFEEYRHGRSDRRVALDVSKHKKDILLSLSPGLAFSFRLSSELNALNGLATPIPQGSQDKLDQFKPQFVAQRLNGNVTAKTGGGVIIANNDGTTHEADVFINATGHGRHNAPAIESLKAQRLATVDLRLDAIATDDSGYRTADEGIPIIGPATHVGIDGIESFAPYCEHLAKRLIASIEPRQTSDLKPQSRRLPHGTIAVAPSIQ